MHELAATYERALGAYLGLALGDALGATVEFLSPEQIQARHGVHRRIVGGGWLALAPGAVTDDTEMSLALGASILAGEGFTARSAADAFAHWLRSGPTDCGHTCRRGIRRYMLEGTLSAGPNPRDAGNGAVMRNLPVVLASLGDARARTEHTLAQCHITHHHPYSDAAALALGAMTTQLIVGEPLNHVERSAQALVAAHPAFAYAGYDGRAGAYVVETVCTVLHSFFATSDFESCLVHTVNRGDDADTTGALAGMLAGARYGVDALPRAWLTRLDPSVKGTIERQTRALLALCPLFSLQRSCPTSGREGKL